MNFLRKRYVAYAITALMVISSTIISHMMYETLYPYEAETSFDEPTVYEDLEDLSVNEHEDLEDFSSDEAYFSYGIQDIQLFNDMQSHHRNRYGLNASFFAPRFILSVFTQLSPPLGDFVEATVPVFTQLGSVNSLMGTHMHAEGYIVEIMSVSDLYGGILLITEYGKIFLNVGFSPRAEQYLANFFETGDLVRAYFSYSGLSLTYNLPMGNLIAIRHKTTVPLENNFVADHVFSYTEQLLLPYRHYFSEIPPTFFVAEPAALGFVIDFLYIEGTVTAPEEYGFTLVHENGEIIVTPYSFGLAPDYFEHYFSTEEQIKLYFVYLGIQYHARYTIAVAFERLN